MAGQPRSHLPAVGDALADGPGPSSTRHGRRGAAQQLAPGPLRKAGRDERLRAHDDLRRHRIRAGGGGLGAQDPHARERRRHGNRPCLQRRGSGSPAVGARGHGRFDHHRGPALWSGAGGVGGRPLRGGDGPIRRDRRCAQGAGPVDRPLASRVHRLGPAAAGDAGGARCDGGRARSARPGRRSPRPVA